MKYYKLANGFTIYLIPVKHARIVRMTLTIKSGTAYETDDTLGYSHILEHILMNSHPKYKDMEPTRITEKNGISMNASTDSDCVDYFYHGSSKYWELMFDMLIGPLHGPKFINKVFNREKMAVLEELKNYTDDQLRDYKDTIVSKLYPNCANGSSIKDIIESTKRCTLSDIKQFYNTEYSPGSCALIVVGNFPIRKLMSRIKEIEKIQLKRQQMPKINVSHFKGQLFVKSPKVKKTYCDIVFHLELKRYDKQFYTAIVLSYMLSGGFLSILYKILRADKKLIYSISADLAVTVYDSDFTISFNTDSKNVDQCIDIIFKEIAKLQDKIDKSAYNIAMKMIETKRDELYTRNPIKSLTNHYQKIFIADSEPITKEKYYTELLKVKPRNIKLFVNKYLNKDNCVLFSGSNINKIRKNVLK